MAEPGSLIARARAQREARRAARKPLDLDVPGYGGTLVVRYGALDWNATHRVLTNERDDAQATLEDNLDTIVKACRALMVRDEAGELVSLADELRAAGEQVAGEVRFDEVALEALELPPVPAAVRSKARAAALAIFGEATSPELAVSLHAGAIGAWMHGADAMVDEEAAGNS
jgi:hypothetical protein